MKHVLDQEPESSLHLEAHRIDRVERFRLRKVITVEDLFKELGYDAMPLKATPAPKAKERREGPSLGRSWGFRAAHRPTRDPRRAEEPAMDALSPMGSNPGPSQGGPPLRFP